MRTSSKRRALVLAALLTCGTLLQSGTSGCLSFAAQNAIVALDVCSILNCESGTFFALCDNPNPLFLDCPQFDGG